MFCTACGTKNAEDSRFCRNCGRKLEKQAAVRITEEEFDRALPEDEQVSALLERAYRQRKDGNTDAALALCDEALALRPDSTTVHSLLGQIYEERGDRERAIEAFERVVQLNPGSIADRVKLDALRGDLPKREQTPHILPAASRHGETMQLPRTAVAVGGVLSALLLAVLVRLLFWPPAPVYRTSPPPVSGSAPRQEAPAVQPAGAAAGTLSSASLTHLAPVSGESTTVGQAAAQFTYPPAPAASAAVGTITRPAPAAPRADKPAGPPRRAAQPNDDSVTNLGPGEYHIRVSKPDEVANGPGSVKLSAPDQPEPGGARASSDANSGVSPTEESKEMIAIATDLKVKGQYREALNGYRRSLPGAGDEAGVVCQNIAWLYQQLGDKPSARDQYQAAITEFKKLDAAGRMTDARRDALRICERGLKICSD